jgi:acetyltransferase-like isoleucine patch superfamily enzyme
MLKYVYDRFWFALSRIESKSKSIMNIAHLKAMRGNPDIHIHELAKVASYESIDNRFGGKIEIGCGTVICSTARLIPYGGSISIGRDCYVGPYSILYGHGGLQIEDDVMIAAHCVIIPANHGHEQTTIPMNKQPLTLRGIVIHQDVWIGAGVRILDGVEIARGSILGAGAVCTKDTEEYDIFGGVPAKKIGSRLRDSDG